MRAKGEGSVYKDRRGRWRASISVSSNGDSRSLRKYRYAKTQNGALKLLRIMQADVDAGRPLDSQRLTLADFLTQWLEDSARPSIRVGSYRNYKHWIDKKIIPGIGGIKLAKLTALHVQNLYGRLERANASPRLREQVHNLLHKAIGQALKWGLVRQNICDAVEKPRVPKQGMRVLNRKQALALLAAANKDRFRALYVVALTTGLRQGELLGLQWDDVDLMRHRITVRHTLQNDRGRLSLAEPKTRRSVRPVEIPKVAVKALRWHKRLLSSERISASPWVFPDTRGGPMRKDNLLRRFKALLANAKLPDVRFHDLRHTAATLMLLQGIHPKIVQEMLGHASISLTLDTYSHVIPSMQRNAAKKMDELFA